MLLLLLLLSDLYKTVWSHMTYENKKQTICQYKDICFCPTNNIYKH